MKRLLIFLMAFVMVFAFSTAAYSQASQEETRWMDISAYVDYSCSAGVSDVVFGEVITDGKSLTTAVGDVFLKCNGDPPLEISIGKGEHFDDCGADGRYMEGDENSECLQYELRKIDGNGAIWGGSEYSYGSSLFRNYSEGAVHAGGRTFTVHGEILPNNAKADIYSDKVRVDILIDP